MSGQPVEEFSSPDEGPWYRGITRYQWMVLLIAVVLIALFPGRRPAAATIVFYRDVYSFRDETVKRDRSETDRLEIHL